MDVEGVYIMHDIFLAAVSGSVSQQANTHRDENDANG